MGKILKLLLVVAIIGSATAGVYAYVSKRANSDPGFTLVEATLGDITEKALAVGQIEPREQFQVKSKVSGIVSRCLVEVGDEVATGDPIFEIAPDPTPQELLNVDHRLRSAATRFGKAKADFDRGRQLHSDGLMSKGDLDSLEEIFDLARVSHEQAQDNQELTRKGKVTGGTTQVETLIRATASGTVLSRTVNPGDPVVPLTSYQPGTELATIADMHDLIFKGTVDEIDVGKITIGMPCRIKVGALPDHIVHGELARIAPQAQRSEGTTLFDVEIELDPDREVFLRAGYSANSDVVIREKTGIVLIPERLVLFEDDGGSTYVEIPGEGPEAEPVKATVELGLSDGLRVEVISGLTDGDQIVQRPPREIS